DCTFSSGSNPESIRAMPYSGALTVENCTFQGTRSPTDATVFIATWGASTTIKDNSFIDAPGDAIDTNGGIITGNYFSGAGYNRNAHAAASWVTASAGPTTITDNLIDGTSTPGDPGGANQALRLTSELGSLTDVTASGNYLFGGTFTVGVGPGGNSAYTISNV